MCQAIKHALQVRYGRVGVSQAKESFSRKQLREDRVDQIPKASVIPGLVPDDSASVVGIDGDSSHLGEHVIMRLVLGGQYGRIEENERLRVCREVHDGLASCLDFPPDCLRVTPAGCNESGFLVDIIVYWEDAYRRANNIPVETEKIGSKKAIKSEDAEGKNYLARDECVTYLLEQAVDPRGPFQSSLAGPKSLWRRCMDPWRGCYPRQPLFAAASLHLVDPLSEISHEKPPAPHGPSTGATSDLLFHMHQQMDKPIERSSSTPYTIIKTHSEPGPGLFDQGKAPSQDRLSVDISGTRKVEPEFIKGWELRNNMNHNDFKPLAFEGEGSVIRPEKNKSKRPVQSVPDLTVWRQNRGTTLDSSPNQKKSPRLVLDGSILWPTPGVSGLEGLRLLDPEDSILYNPARAMEELGQLGQMDRTIL